jgi:RimJ/RimL family protein N-acetyltransferase
LPERIDRCDVAGRRLQAKQMLILTARTILRPWREADRPAFAAMHADPEVMRDVNGPLTRAQSDGKMDRYGAALAEHGFCRWAVDDRDGHFIGYAGVMPIPAHFPLAPGFEVGWRLVRNAWGMGLASEAAAAALTDVFARTPLVEVLSYTAPDNIRSQAVMRRLALRRDRSRDFVIVVEGLPWSGWVWAADRARHATG